MGIDHQFRGHVSTRKFFLYDRIQDSLTLVSRKDDAIGDDESTDATVTPDGRFVLFQSSATNLSTNDVNEVAWNCGGPITDQ